MKSHNKKTAAVRSPSGFIRIAFAALLFAFAAYVCSADFGEAVAVMNGGGSTPGSITALLRSLLG